MLIDRVIKWSSVALTLYIAYYGLTTNYQTDHTMMNLNQDEIKKKSQYVISIDPKKPYSDYNYVEKAIYNFYLNDEQRHLINKERQGEK